MIFSKLPLELIQTANIYSSSDSGPQAAIQLLTYSVLLHRIIKPSSAANKHDSRKGIREMLNRLDAKYCIGLQAGLLP